MFKIPGDKKTVNERTGIAQTQQSLRLWQEVVFRLLTPVFRYTIEGATGFTHCGNFGNAHFEIVHRPYAANPTDWAEVTKYADDGVRDLLQKRVIHFSHHFMCAATHFLLTDVSHPAESVSEGAGNSMTIKDAVEDALRLHSSAGLSFEDTFTFRWPPSSHSGLGIHSPNTRQVRFSYLGTPSVLRSADFDACRSTIETLIRKTWNNSTFDQVLRLAMQYHRLPEFLWHGAEAYGFRGDVWTCDRMSLLRFCERTRSDLSPRTCLPSVEAIGLERHNCQSREPFNGTNTPFRTGRDRVWPLLKKQARSEGFARTLLFTDESGFYLLPGIVRTYAPMGGTPVLTPSFRRATTCPSRWGHSLPGSNRVYTMVGA